MGEAPLYPGIVIGETDAEIRRAVSVPVGVGFGIRDAASAQAIAAHADAVVIGSRIIQEIEAATPETAADRAAAWHTLLNAGVTHVVVHEAAYFDGKGARISDWLRSAGATELAANGTDRLFALK